MSIFDKDRIGQQVCCDLAHADSGDRVTGYIPWHLAIVGETARRVLTSGSSYLAGPWTVVTVDVPLVVKS